VFEALERVILGCLHRLPDSRYQSAHEIVRALEAIGPIDAIGGGGRSDSRPARASHADQDRGSRAAHGAVWWWQFHQAAASVTYLALLVPLWWVHDWRPGLAALLLFLAGLMASLVASLLRWHLWFAVRSYPSEWGVQRGATRGPILVADIVFAIVLFVAAVLVLADHSRVATLLVGAAVAVVVSFAVIEPATTRAAFQT
jgi:hypothetical protein